MTPLHACSIWRDRAWRCTWAAWVRATRTSTTRSAEVRLRRRGARDSGPLPRRQEGRGRRRCAGDDACQHQPGWLGRSGERAPGCLQGGGCDAPVRHAGRAMTRSRPWNSCANCSTDRPYAGAVPDPDAEPLTDPERSTAAEPPTDAESLTDAERSTRGPQRDDCVSTRSASPNSAVPQSRQVVARAASSGPGWRGAMLAVAEIYEGPPKEDAPVTVEASSDPTDIDKDGVRRHRRRGRRRVAAARSTRPRRRQGPQTTPDLTPDHVVSDATWSTIGVGPWPGRGKSRCQRRGDVAIARVRPRTSSGAKLRRPHSPLASTIRIAPRAPVGCLSTAPSRFDNPMVGEQMMLDSVFVPVPARRRGWRAPPVLIASAARRPVSRA